MKPICYIVGAGDFNGLPHPPRPEDLLIAADAGYAALLRFHLEPNLIIGDFDSMERPEGGNVLALNPIKDDTDLAAAVREGLNRGYTCFHIYGGLGGKRLSHTLANLQLLAWLSQRGAEGFLFGEGITVTAITNGSHCFQKEATGYLSVFAHNDICSGVTETGLKYPLDEATLANAVPLGISNEFIGEESCVSVREGTLILVWETRC